MPLQQLLPNPIAHPTVLWPSECALCPLFHPLIGNANADAPVVRKLGSHPRTGEIVPFVSRTFEWGVAVATFFSVLSIVPRRCALTYFFHPKLRKVNAVLFTPVPCGTQEEFP